MGANNRFIHLPKNTRASHSGFTIIELVVVIVVLGIVSVGMSGVIRQAMDSVITLTERENLVAQGSFLSERFNRELSLAIPNSARISGDALTQCIEFVPTLFSSTYLTLPISGSSDDTADLIELSDVNGRAFTPTTSDFAIVYPTSAQQVYTLSEEHRQAVVSCSDDGSDSDCSTLDDSDKVVQLEVSSGFAQTSPSRRIYIARNAISYCMRNNEVYRHEDSINESQTVYTSGGDLMAQDVLNQLTPNPATGPQSPFKSVAAAQNRNAAIQSLFIFGRENERVTFMQEVLITNAP